jgi:hypothetical protein
MKPQDPESTVARQVAVLNLMYPAGIHPAQYEAACLMLALMVASESRPPGASTKRSTKRKPYRMTPARLRMIKANLAKAREALARKRAARWSGKERTK